MQPHVYEVQMSFWFEQKKKRTLKEAPFWVDMSKTYVEKFGKYHDPYKIYV